MRSLLLGLLGLILTAPLAAAEKVPLEKGTVRFTPADDQANIPERYRLESRTFDYELYPKRDMKELGVIVQSLRFPPRSSRRIRRTTRFMPSTRPLGQGAVSRRGRWTSGRRSVSLSPRLTTHVCRRRRCGPVCANGLLWSASAGQRQAPSLSPDLKQTFAAHPADGARPASGDGVAGVASGSWTPQRLGILGASLGSLVGALTAEMEPKLRRVAVLLGGAGFVDAFWDDPQAQALSAGLRAARRYQGQGQAA